MKRRALLAGIGVLVVGGAAGITAVAADPTTDEPPADDPTTGDGGRTSARVVRTDLVDREDLDGTLGFGTPVDLAIGRQGVITALPPAGTVVERGGSVAEVNGLPVPLLVGSRPFWRKLTADPVGPDGLPTDQLSGPDVRILEENLQALGFIDADSDAKVDDTFTGSTANAVKAWQKSLGMPETGVVDPVDVVVHDGPVRISGHQAAVGAQSGGPVLSITGTERTITVQLAADRQGLLAVADAVEVDLPDGTTAPATVTTVGTVVTPGDEMQGTSDTIEIVVGLDDPAAAGTYDSTPVVVSVVRSRANGVLAVPVGALMALSEGGYAVERIDAGDDAGDGTTLVGVQIGAFADGLVQVEGDLAEGDEVVVPS